MRIALLVSPALLAACYTYAPIDSATVTPGMSVRARVTASTAEQLQPLLATTDARLLTGTVIAHGPDTLVVEVPAARAEYGATVQTLHQRVSIPRTSVLELEMRTLNRARTGVVAAAAALIVGAVVFKAVRGDPGKERFPGGPGGPELHLPLFRVRP